MTLVRPSDLIGANSSVRNINFLLYLRVRLGPPSRDRTCSRAIPKKLCGINLKLRSPLQLLPPAMMGARHRFNYRQSTVPTDSNTGTIPLEMYHLHGWFAEILDTLGRSAPRCSKRHSCCGQLPLPSGARSPLQRCNKVRRKLQSLMGKNGGRKANGVGIRCFGRNLVGRRRLQLAHRSYQRDTQHTDPAQRRRRVPGRYSLCLSRQANPRHQYLRSVCSALHPPLQRIGDGTRRYDSSLDPWRYVQ